VRARAIEVPQPVYPESKREAGTEGRVRVEIRVDATGAVTEARVLQSLSPEFDAAALEAARQGRFASATRCGEPVASTFVISIRFQL
jgi:protein TonB